MSNFLRSNCDKNQAETATFGAASFDSQGSIVQMMALRIVKNFLMHATNATYLGLPSASKC